MVELTKEARESASRCPFCHAAVRDGERLWSCPRCSTIHHQDCARENGQCTVLGCPELVLGGTIVAAAPLPPVDRSPRQAASSFQDFLVLAVCLPIMGAGVAGGLGLGWKVLLLGEKPSSDAVGIVPVVVSLAFVVLMGAGMRWARRRDRGEDG